MIAIQVIVLLSVHCLCHVRDLIFYLYLQAQFIQLAPIASTKPPLIGRLGFTFWDPGRPKLLAPHTRDGGLRPHEASSEARGQHFCPHFRPQASFDLPAGLGLGLTRGLLRPHKVLRRTHEDFFLTSKIQFVKPPSHPKHQSPHEDF